MLDYVAWVLIVIAIPCGIGSKFDMHIPIKATIGIIAWAINPVSQRQA